MFGRGVSLRDYFEALRASDQRAVEPIDAADARALELARDIQNYKDEKANDLRSQIEGERGLYATKDEVHALRETLMTYIAAQASRSATSIDWRTTLIALAAIAAVIIVKFA
jgi:hypothetical protein